MTSELNNPMSSLAEANVSSKQTLGFFVARPDGHIVEANAVLLKRLGMTQEALRPGDLLHCQSILSTESWTLWEQQWPDLARQRFIAPLAVVFRSLDGHLLSAQVSITALRDGSGSGACIVQFEEPGQVADAAKLTFRGRPASASAPESMTDQDRRPVSVDDMQYFRMLTDASPAQIFDMAPDGTVRFLNQTALDYFDPERMPEIREGRWAPEVHPDDLENITHFVQQALGGEMESYRIEMRLKRRDGVYRWFFHTGKRCYYSNGDFYGLIGYSIDITAFKEAELELKASEERFRIIANASPAHIFDMAPDGTFRFLNQAVMDFLSLDRQSEIMVGRWDSEVHPDDRENMAQLVQQALEGKLESYRLEFRSKQRDGVYRWFYHSGNRCYYPNGDFYGLVGYTIDISALKEAELELKASEERFRIMANASPAHIFDLAPDGTFRFQNQAILDFLSVERLSEIKKGNWASEVHPDDRENFTRLVQQALAGKRESYRIELRFKGWDGVYRWFLSSGVPTYYPNGDFYGLIGYSIDITALKEAELELKASEERFRIIANASPAHIFDMAPDGTFRFLNQAALDFLSPECMPELMKGYWAPAIHPDDLENVARLVQNALEGKRESYRLEIRFKQRDGVYRWFLHSGMPTYYPNGDFYGLVGYSIDITALKEAEFALRESEERFRVMANASPAHIFDVSPEGRTQFVNQTALNFFEPGAEENFRKGNIVPYFHPDDIETLRQHIQQALETREGCRYEVRARRQDGQYRWLLCSMGPSLYPDGTLHGLIGSAIDITERKEIEQALRQSEARWRDMANVVPIMLWVSDTRGEVVFINDWWYQYTGLSLGESLGMPWMAMVHPEDIASVLGHNQKYLLDEPFEIECRYRRADGAYRWHFSRVVPAKDKNGKVLNWYGTSVDIHDRRIVEQELSKARDLAEDASKKKSQFLANMSHELRTPLNAVIGFSDMMKNGMAGPLTDRQNDYIGHISTSGQHLLTLVNDILDISKAEAGRIELFLQYVELEPFIQQLQELVRYSAENSNVTVTFEVQPGLAGLVADSNRLKQIFMNLLSNAVKFNHRGGQVNVSLARSEDKQWVICAIRDTGIGIPADKIGNLFSEFYQVDSSIARHYEGTGLGLALAKRLVELHHGIITVESQVDVGSTFIFKLPSNPYALDL